MKFSVLSVLALLMASIASADPAPALQVQIGSFAPVGAPGSQLGELCGTVTVSGPGARLGNLIPVTVVADPNTNNPGPYTVLADRIGNFCVLLKTYTGTAAAEAWLPGTNVPVQSSVAHWGLSRR